MEGVMASLELSTPPRAEATRSISIDVVPLATGGWDVIAAVGGRVVVVRHCTDWHRAERARRLLQISLPSGPPVTLTQNDAHAA
jgi:hypothetical protein